MYMPAVTPTGIVVYLSPGGSAFGNADVRNVVKNTNSILVLPDYTTHKLPANYKNQENCTSKSGKGLDPKSAGDTVGPCWKNFGKFGSCLGHQGTIVEMRKISELRKVLAN